MDVDFGKTAEDYRTHRADFPPSFFERLASLSIGVPGQRIVDVGTGTGTLARGFARRGCRVIGIDPSAAMLAQARCLDRKAGVEIEYRQAKAEDTTLAAASADVVTAGQCWHWFDRDAAARESARILVEGGRIVIAHFDWIPLPGNVVRATEELIETFNPAWKFGNLVGIHPRWLRDLGEAGFGNIETFSYDVDVEYTPVAWRGRIRASAGVGASLPGPEVCRFDRALCELLKERFPDPVLSIPHRIFAVVAVNPRRHAP